MWNELTVIWLYVLIEAAYQEVTKNGRIRRSGPEPKLSDAEVMTIEILGEMCEQGLLVAAGPFADQSGALLLFASDDVAEVKSALARDPYYVAPGVQIATIQPWTVVTGAV